jgi:hypothetical protein
VDCPTSSPDVGKGVIYFTAYHNQSDIGERLVAILPAYVQTFGDKQQWFHAGTLQSLGEVFFGYDDKGNWDGTWHTAEDDLAQDILDEDMGIEFDFDNLDDLEQQMAVLLTTEDASVSSFGTALGAKAINTSQHKESGIPAAASAVAASGGNGPAV